MAIRIFVFSDKAISCQISFDKIFIFRQPYLATFDKLEILHARVLFCINRVLLLVHYFRFLYFSGLTSTTEPPSFEFKKRLCYTGDFDEDTVVAQFPENARKFYHLAKSEIVSKNKEIRSLRKEHKRLKKRVANLIKMLYEFRERHIIIGDVSSI